MNNNEEDSRAERLFWAALKVGVIIGGLSFGWALVQLAKHFGGAQ